METGYTMQCLRETFHESVYGTQICKWEKKKIAGGAWAGQPRWSWAGTFQGRIRRRIILTEICAASAVLTVPPRSLVKPCYNLVIPVTLPFPSPLCISFLPSFVLLPFLLLTNSPRPYLSPFSSSFLSSYSSHPLSWGNFLTSTHTFSDLHLWTASKASTIIFTLTSICIFSSPYFMSSFSLVTNVPSSQPAFPNLHPRPSIKFHTKNDCHSSKHQYYPPCKHHNSKYSRPR